MDLRAGREEKLRHWFFESKEINTDTELASSLPWQISQHFHSCSCFVFSSGWVWGYHLTKVWVTESSWSKGTQDLIQLFLLRVKRALNSDLLFYPVRSGKNPRAEMNGWENGCDWVTPRAEGMSCLGNASSCLGAQPRPLEIPFPMTQQSLLWLQSASSLENNLSLFHIMFPFVEELQEVSHMTAAVEKSHFQKFS